MPRRVSALGTSVLAVLLGGVAFGQQSGPAPVAPPAADAPQAPAGQPGRAGAPGGRGMFGPPAPKPTEPELVGTLPWATAMGPVQYLQVQVGDGGSGRYKAALVGDPNLPTHTLYRPKDLAPFGARLKLPIVAYANGGCANRSNEVRNFLTEVASHGFLIVAIGPAIDSAFGGTSLGGGTPTTPAQLLDAIAWATAENTRAGSPYVGRIDTTKVAVMGQSCGGVQAMDVSLDPRVSTTVLLNSGLFAAGAGRGRGMGGTTVTKDALAKLHAPILYLIGGKGDVAFPNAADDFARIDTVPVFMANREVGHYPATYLEPRGGAFGVAASAWMKWQLKGDLDAAKMFKGGAACGLCADSKWTIEKKKID